MWAGALGGVVAALAGLAAGEVIAGLDGHLRGPVVAVGDRVVDLVPSTVRSWAISTFGTSDKVVLQAGVLVLLVVAAASIGVLAQRRSLRVALCGVGAFTAVGVAASLGRGGSGWARPLPPIAAGLVAGSALVALTRRAVAAWPPVAPDAGSVGRAPGIGGDRRQFLRFSAGCAGAAVLAGGVGRWLQQRGAAVAERLRIVLPHPVRPLPTIPAAVHARGAVPFVTPNDDFYRIDTALAAPRVSTDGWRLDVSGRVRRRISITYEELLARPMVEADITICCVSNEVGGELIGTARWLGCRLDDLLDEAGVDPSADQVVGRSVDGFTAGFPTTLLDGRPALVAVGMNGEPLPIDHGFPARLVVPGVYGYVSATKWLRQIDLTSFADFDAYWIPRGWSRLGPVKTQSRIDTPASGRVLHAGRPVTVAGVAWAMDRRISRVQVRIVPVRDRSRSDAEDWQDAILADELNDTTWRQWHLVWTPERGEHAITVRATDGAGATQTEEPSDVAPDGATGWHTIQVGVT